MPAPRVRPVAEAASKWKRRAEVATTDYTDGAANAGGRWATNAAAGNQNYVTGVTAAAQAGRFAKGVQKAGAGKYQRGITDKGAARYAPGVAAGDQDYQTGVAPYLTALASLDLPPRGPRGTASNINRVATVAKALRDLKMAR